MNRHISRLGILAAIAAMMAGTAFAGSLDILLRSATHSTGIISITSGTSYVNSDFNGWDIQYLTPTTNSPSATPWGLNLGGFVAACENPNGCADFNDLEVALSGTGFTTPAGKNGFTTALVNNNIPGSGAATGSITQSAYYDSSDSLFGGEFDIGTVSVSGFGGEYVTGGYPVSGTYSLTLIDTFSTSCTGSGCAIFSFDGSIADNGSKVPEPGALALFVAGLLGCALAIGRRHRAPQSGVLPESHGTAADQVSVSRAGFR